MRKEFEQTDRISTLVHKQKRNSWFMNATWIVLLLMSSLLWQCDKDTFEGETAGLCPEVISTDPANDATNVVTNKLISATFNKGMVPASINGETFTVKQGETPVSGIVTYTDKVATFTPTKPLEANKTYTGTITKKATDPEGNFPLENYVWNFSTGNVPRVIATDPITAASSVPLNKIITATFSTAMNPLTINTATFLVNQGVNVITGTVTYAGTTATFTPTIPLADNTVYTGTITIDAKDLAGNALASHYKWSFSTAQTQYTITLTSNPAIGGSTSGGGLFNLNDEATVVAAPAAGYTFTNWTEGSNVASTNSNYTFTATSNRALVANFAINTFSLNVTSINGTVVKVPNQTTFNYGTSVLLTAVPNAGYSFTGWSGDATGTSNSVTVLMNSNKNITATFALTPPDTYTLNVTATLGGTAVKNPNQTGYTSGTSVQVTATPIAGYTFSGWTGDATGTTNPLSVNMNSNKNIVANFTLIPVVTYSLNVTSNNGVVVKNPNLANYAQGSTVQLSATPNVGYTFAGWSGDATGTTNPLTVTMNSNKNITALFTLIPASTYTLNTIAVNGTVLKNPNQTNYTAGTNVQLTATPNTGYTFSGWSGDATGTENPLLVQMNSNKNITAIFTLTPVNTYTLNVLAVNGTVLKNPNLVNYNQGATVQLTATPLAGYTFSGWSGDAIGNNNPLTVIMNSNKNITANFTLIPVNTFTLNVIAVNGTVLKNPNLVNYNQGATVQLTATPNTGFVFTNWSGDATGTNNPVTVTMNANKTVTANFTALPSGPAGVNLGSAGDFAILAGSGISNTGVSTMINGDVGSFPTATINGLLSGNVNGTLYTSADPIVGLAKVDLTTAFNDAQSRSLNAISLPGQIGGLTLAPGLYVNSTTSGISGTGPNGILTLDAGGNPNAVWIFKVGSTFITDAGTSIVLAGGAQAKNIYWSVGTSATLGTNSIFYGNILADQAITLTTGATLTGRALTRIAAVSLDTNSVTKP